MRRVSLPDGTQVPQLGLGTWKMGESASTRRREIAAVRTALTLGYRLIDTAEMYGDGGAEEVVGAALRDAIAAGEVRRDEVSLVTKVLPGNASRRGTIAACERSLGRLQVDAIDLYLLHWRGAYTLADTVAAFEELRAQGRIRRWGVSNFDVKDMKELWQVENGARCAANQVYYSASQRGIEFDLLPWQRDSNVPAMAYCPIDQGALASDANFATIARRRGITAAQVALAWVLRQPDVIAIPKSVNESHLRENLEAALITLSPQELAEIDQNHPPPKRKRSLAMT